MARTSISLVSVQKPTANTPVLQRRNKAATRGIVLHWRISAAVVTRRLIRSSIG